MTDTPDILLRTAVLRHTTVDGEAHFDWLLAVDDPPVRRLITARLPMSPADVRTERAEAHAVDASYEGIAFEPIATHRVLYLTYEGPIPGGRGTVERVAEGRWMPCFANAEDASPGRVTRILNGRTDPQPSEAVWPRELIVCWDVAAGTGDGAHRRNDGPAVSGRTADMHEAEGQFAASATDGPGAGGVRAPTVRWMFDLDRRRAHSCRVEPVAIR